MSNNLYNFSNNLNYSSLSLDYNYVPPSYTNLTSSTTASNANSLNSLDSGLYRGVRVESPSLSDLGGLSIPSLHSFNPKQHNATSQTSFGKKSELSLNPAFHAYTIPEAQLYTLQSFSLRSEPAYVERYTSFVCVLPLNDIFTSLSSTLKESCIEFNLSESKSKFECVTYDAHNNSIQFYIRVFKAAKQANTNCDDSNCSKVVEFQRSSGCCVGFNRTFQHVQSQLNIANKVPYTHHANGTSTNTAAPTMSTSLLSLNQHLPFPKPVLDAECLNQLMSMIRCDDLCSSREALRALLNADLYRTFANNEKALQSLIETLSYAMNRAVCDEEQQRNSTAILVELTTKNDKFNCKEFSSLLLNSSLFTSLFTVLDSPSLENAITNSVGLLQNRYTKKFISQILLNLVQADQNLFQTKFRSNQENLNILKKFEFHHDERIAQNIKSILSSL